MNNMDIAIAINNETRKNGGRQLNDVPFYRYAYILYVHN